ncbi:MAG: UDP-N-acetylmuramate--L-alanine ligase [Gudongella sp.]|nr:UDP-N-acetylmuramate--L-alanine ligase [Gudongella sp.]
MFEFNLDNPIYSKVHFIGIGGISMSGLAKILINNNYIVSGSDANDSLIVSELIKLGATVTIGHSKDNIKDVDLVIYTDAISPENEELLAAIESNATVVDRAKFLGSIMKNYKHSIAVSGTHGKTTTTSMIATVMNHTTLNPTILLGGELDDIGGNIKLGSDDYLLTEACEYKANILKYFPTMAIVLNIDEDHLDFFKSISHIKDTFKSFLMNLTKDNCAILNLDDANTKSIIEDVQAKIISFGIEEESDYRAKNIEFDANGFPKFDVFYKGYFILNIKLSVMGIHNIYNSLAAIATCHNIGIESSHIKTYISSYTGVHRRLEHKGFLEGIEIIDDYAHHPTEIKASLNALRKSTKEKIYCIFQPHTFTRTRILLDSFSEAFNDADKIIIADIYAAREKDCGEIHSRDLAKRIREKGKDAIYLSSFEDIENYIIKEASNHDVVVTMGAGNIYQIGDSLISKNLTKVI